MVSTAAVEVALSCGDTMEKVRQCDLRCLQIGMLHGRYLYTHACPKIACAWGLLGEGRLRAAQRRCSEASKQTDVTTTQRPACVKMQLPHISVIQLLGTHIPDPTALPNARGVPSTL